jgi:hypothetical protein
MIHAYVLMMNQVHALMTPRGLGGIPLLRRAIGRRYVNVLYRRTVQGI